MGMLSGTVDEAPMPTGRRFSCPIIDTHRTSEHRRGSNPGSSRGMPSEWNVLVRVPGDLDIDEREIDISALNKDDLCRLRTDDPFLYYSIPSMRRLSYLCSDDEGGDTIMIENSSSSSSSSSSSRRSSLPPDFRSPQNAQIMNAAKDTIRKESIVRRNRRLSTEAHPSLILEEMMLLEFQELDDVDEDCDGDMEDVLEQLFKGENLTNGRFD
jgi:hypothetical protein